MRPYFLKCKSRWAGFCLLLFSVIHLGGACSSGGGSSNNSNNLSVSPNLVAETYANIVQACYEDSLALVQTLRLAIDAFVASPSANTLEDAKQAWLNAREFYGQTEAFRFYSGPVDDADGPEGLMNAWPLDEAYIDYVDGNPNAGIINDPVNFPTLTKDVLAGLNENGSDTNISTGFHAIEFLLWGQDLSAANGAGDRQFTDYVTGGGGTNANQDRRGQYIKIVAELLAENLQQMIDEWAPGNSANYRAEFLSVDPNEALRRILVGIGSLSGGELRGERMSVAYNTKDKEDEHSCFSDNTHRDFIANQRGIQNVFTGRYVRVNGTVVEGPGLDDLLNQANSTLNTQVLSQFQTVSDALQQINSNAPFDQQILGDDTSPGRVRVKAAIDALQTQTSLIAQAAAALGISVNLDPDGV